MVRYMKSDTVTEPRPSLGGHIPALDGVRGLAGLLIIIHHMAASLNWEFGWHHPLVIVSEIGWVGVDLFFVLSGFLITGILVDAKGSQGYFRTFYARRTLRIFPLYYLSLSLLFCLGLVWPGGGIYPEVSQGWLWIYATNVVISLKGFGIFGAVEHFWSLAVEEHFYLMWPLIVYAFDRRRLMRIALAIMGVAFCIRVGMVLLEAVRPAPYVFTFARMDALAVGAFLALAAREYGSVAALRRRAVLCGAVAATIFAAIVLSQRSFSATNAGIVTIGSSALAATFGSLIVLAVTEHRVRRVFEWSSLRTLGKYSYGLYVWHPLLFIIVMHSEPARALRGGNGVTEAILSSVVAVAVTAVATAVSWHLYEKQFLKLKDRFPTGPGPRPSRRHPVVAAAVAQQPGPSSV